MSTGPTAAGSGHSSAVGSETRKRLEQSERERLLQDLFTTVNRVAEAQQALADCEREMEECQQELEQVYGSVSWRVTLPLRKASLYARRLSHPQEMLTAVTASGLGVLTRHPKIRDLLRKILDRFPSLREAVRKVVAPVIVSNWSAQDVDYARSITLDKLPGPARRVYQELKAELADHRPS